MIRSLSARLLVLTIFFVMLGEVMIFVPSVARFRMTYLENRIEAGELAILALSASPSGQVERRLTSMLLARVGAHAITLRRADGVVRMLDSPQPLHPAATIALGPMTAAAAIEQSLATLFSRGNRLLRVVGQAPDEPGTSVALILDEAPMRHQMWGFGRRILQLSIVISLLTATLVYLSLHWLMVRPMRRITASMTLFRQDPEDASRSIQPSGRKDEIGRAERELAVLQETVRQALGHNARLAALGTAVTKISHDLRNILATARLVTDGLTASAAPEVRRVAPRLLDAVDRAIALCVSTLDFSREGAPPFAPTRFALAPLVAEIGPGLAQAEDSLAIEIAVPPELAVSADRDQLYRVLLNLARNAVEAGAAHLRIAALAQGGTIALDIADDGHGLPPRARENLFRPFFGSGRPGGSGLGLAIARELMRAHRGDLVLVSSTGSGTLFRLVLPAAGGSGATLNRARA